MPVHRAEALGRLRGSTVDLLVIGGGIVGARVAFEAARSGLAVALVDAGDFGGATSSASSKLVHGGFRYLPMGDVALVRQSQRERRLLLDVVAPNLVRRIPFLLPVYQSSPKGPSTVTGGLLLYRALAGRGGDVGLIGNRSAREWVPALRLDGLRMCGMFEEAETIDARLVLATVKAAARSGAIVLNHARVVGLDLRHNRGGAAAIDAGPDGVVDLHARHVVNAAGPYVDDVRRLDEPLAAPLVRLSKGVHVLMQLPGAWRAGVALPLPGGRVALGVPWLGILLLGTTDTLHTGDPADARVTAADTSTVLAEASQFLPNELVEPSRVRFDMCGLRALPIAEGDTAAARRGHMIEVGRNGLVSVAGGKLTTHRLIAVDALRRVPDPRLPGLKPYNGRLPGTGWSRRIAASTWLASDIADNLERLYGDEAGAVLDLAAAVPDGMERIHRDGPDIWAQAAYAVGEEWALSSDDIARRRTTLSVRGLLTPAIAARLAELCHERTMPRSLAAR